MLCPRITKTWRHCGTPRVPNLEHSAQLSTSEIEFVQAGTALRSLASSVTSLIFICMAKAMKRAS
jgi:hypothetical protein